MPREKYQKKLMKHRLCTIARIVASTSFLILAIIGVSSIVRAMSLEKVANNGGIPTTWDAASVNQPKSITVPITYWDQKSDWDQKTNSCSAANRQFEWVKCGYWTKGALQGVVKDKLGNDGLPIPKYDNPADAWAANHDIFTMNVTGDNFYRWFHQVPGLSEEVPSTITFDHIGDRQYTYGGQNVFPLDKISTSLDDGKIKIESGEEHNYHFTAHLSFPIKVENSGKETFEFSGDDDVWVFLNGKLVLDIGGLHEKIKGSFVINQDGTLSTFVERVNDVSVRTEANTSCMKKERGDSACVNSFNALLADEHGNPINLHDISIPNETTPALDIGLKKGDVVNLDFFYAERSTTESNTKITISNMNWPISADSDVKGQITGKIEETNSNIINYISSIRNRDPNRELQLDRLAVFIDDEASKTDADGKVTTCGDSGFIPLSKATLEYSYEDSDDAVWQPLDIAPPRNSLDGFLLTTPLIMSPAGGGRDQIFFRYSVETSACSGEITNITSYYTQNNGVSGVAYDEATIPYTGNSNSNSSEETIYNLDIDYVIDFNGEEPEEGIVAPDHHHEELKTGESYRVTSPNVAGFTPDYSVVKGTMADGDIEVTVVYRRTPETSKHKVTIHYVKDDGSKAFPDYTSEHENGGETFEVPSPELEGYDRDTDVVEVTVPSEGDIEYFVYYTPIKHRVIVHYVYANGSKALDDYDNQFGEGKEFTITSPNIEGYIKDIAIVNGIMGKEDREFTVTYIANVPGPSPIVPNQPSQPDQPSQDTPVTPTRDPSKPITPPTNPDKNDNLIPSIVATPSSTGDELTYLSPLGEVAFVPNTGIISDTLAPIFDQFFADIILSQWFVLAMLLIFSGSFATYFSLRKYADLNLATVSSRSTAKKMPKSVANSKTARTMQKNAQRSARKNGKR